MSELLTSRPFISIAATLAVVIAIVSAWAFWPTGSGGFASAEDVSRAIAAEKEQLLETLSGGGTLTIEIEQYAKDRWTPEIFPEFMQAPDRIIQYMSITVDADGIITAQATAIHDEGGELLATVEHREDGIVYISPDGSETFDFPAPSAVGRDVPLIPWIEAMFELDAAALENEGFTITGASTLAGMDSTVLTGARTVHEVANENPLIRRTAMYVTRDGEEVLDREMTWLSWEATPAGN